MKIAFFGISKYGFSYLNYLVDQKKDYKVIFVTNKFKTSPHVKLYDERLKNFCKSKNIKFFPNINVNVNKEIFDYMQDIDLSVIGGYDLILKKKLLKLPKIGTINTHFGLIPQNRGMNPIVWALLKSEKQGLTNYFVTEKIDFGKIINQITVNIKPKDTAKEIYDKLSKEAIQIFPQTLYKAKSKIFERTKNKKLKNQYNSGGMPNDRWVSWNWTVEFILLFSRANTFSPYPNIRTFSDSLKQEFEFKVEKIESIYHNNDVGILFRKTKNNLFVWASNGFVVINFINKKFHDLVSVGQEFKSIEGDIQTISNSFKGKFLRNE